MSATAQRRDLPCITKDQMVEVDRLMTEEAHISLLQMMENAGRSLADFAVDQFAPGRVAILVGKGGNGGGGLVAARHLSNRGVVVDVIPSADPIEFRGVPKHQLRALDRTSAVVVGGVVSAPDLIIDALIGYSLSGPPRKRARELIEWANEAHCPIVSLDIPSGVDSTTGRSPGVAIAATATLTLALPKLGLSRTPCAGEVHLADISVPPDLYKNLDVDVPADLFADSQIIRLW